MKYLENQLCLEYDEFVPSIMSEANYKQSKNRGNITVHGRGGNGHKVLIEFESLPPKYKVLVEAKFGDPYKHFARQPLLQLVKKDLAARAFYEGYMLPDGRYLPAEYQTRYSRQCDWLNMIQYVLTDKKALRHELHITMDEFWINCIALHRADNPVNPELPQSRERLQRKLRLFQKEGYGSLVEAHRFTQGNARKVDSSIEHLLLALYCRHDKPFLRQVCQEYRDFMAGRIQVVDLQTGELFDPAQYYVNGLPYEVKEATVKHYINKPLNRAVVDKFRMSALQFSTTHRPYMQRNKPVYAFSMVTMDDTSSPFKMAENQKRPATYKAFDVASEAVVAMVISREPRPNVEMIREVHRRMLALVVSKGWRMPAEVQIEQALNSEMKGRPDADGMLVEDVLTAGAVYPFVSFCKSRNPQEKLAENIIGRFKYHLQKRRQGFQHRPFGKTEATRMNDDSPSHKTRYTYQQIEAMEQADVDAWNNELHSNQDLYPGLTRWQVLEQYQNPELSQPNLPLIMQYVGNRTETSLRRGYVQVQYDSYVLPDVAVLGMLDRPKMTACWLEDSTGDIPEVYLYQDGRFVCKASRVEKFQVAKAEQTDDDLRKFGRQQQYVRGFDAMVAERLGNVPKAGVVRAELEGTVANEWVREDAEAAELTEGEDVSDFMEEPQQFVENQPEEPQKMQKKGVKKGGYVQKKEGLDAFLFDPESVRMRALKGL